MTLKSSKLAQTQDSGLTMARSSEKRVRRMDTGPREACQVGHSPEPGCLGGRVARCGGKASAGWPQAPLTVTVS